EAEAHGEDRLPCAEEHGLDPRESLEGDGDPQPGEELEGGGHERSGHGADRSVVVGWDHGVGAADHRAEYEAQDGEPCAGEEAEHPRVPPPPALPRSMQRPDAAKED